MSLGRVCREHLEKSHTHCGKKRGGLSKHPSESARLNKLSLKNKNSALLSQTFSLRNIFDSTHDKKSVVNREKPGIIPFLMN